MSLRSENGTIASVLLSVVAVTAMLAYFLMHQGDEFRAMNERYRVPRAELSFQLRQILDCTQTPLKNGACRAPRMATIYDVNGTKRWDPVVMTFTDRKGLVTEYRVLCRGARSYVLQTRPRGSREPWAKAETIACP